MGAYRSRAKQVAALGISFTARSTCGAKPKLAGLSPIRRRLPITRVRIQTPSPATPVTGATRGGVWIQRDVGWLLPGFVGPLLAHFAACDCHLVDFVGPIRNA